MKFLLNFISLILKMRVMLVCSRYFWVSRDIVFFIIRMFGRGFSEVIFEMLFFRNFFFCGVFIFLLINFYIYYIIYMFC